MTALLLMLLAPAVGSTRAGPVEARETWPALAPQRGVVVLGPPAAPPRVADEPTPSFVRVAGPPRPADDIGPSGPMPQLAQVANTGGLFLTLEATDSPAVGGTAAVRVYLANGGTEIASLPTWDNRLALSQEAWIDNAWVPIETVDGVGGGSSHPVLLPPHHAWAFTLPRYDGPNETRLRFALQTEDGRVVSAVYAGGVTDGQLAETRPTGSTPIGSTPPSRTPHR